MIIHIPLAVLLYLLFLFALSQANAQNPNSNNLTTYQNATLGFSIHYPQEWKVGTNKIENEELVSFTSPENSIPIFYVRVSDVGSYLDTNTMTLRNKTVEQIVQDHISQFSKPNSLGVESKLIRQNPFNFASYSGWKVELFLGPQNDPYFYAYEVLTIVNGKFYTLEYNERPLKVPQTLPIVNKVLESFRVLTATEKEKLIEAKPQPPPQPGYHSSISPLIDNGTLGYKSLFERTTNPKKFSPELQTLINATCDKVRKDYSSFGSIDRNWFLANC